jgi:hypothetical protein
LFWNVCDGNFAKNLITKGEEMYESPKLNRVGAAQDVILGVLPSGDDIDMNYVNDQLEYADDGDGGLPPQS